MGFIGGLLGTNSSYEADTGFLKDQTLGSAGNNMALQKMLMEQAQGGGPNLADQQNRVAVNRNQAAMASLLGSMKGISPAAMMRGIANAQGQAGADAAGQAATARMQQQLEAQRLLGVNTLGMTGIGANYQANAQGLNAQTAAQNAANNTGLLGGLIGGAGSALGFGLGGGGGAAAGGLNTKPPVLMSPGGTVPGRAPAAGDSYANDTVPAMLSPGEIVIPRSIAQGPNAPDRAAEFVEHIRATSKPEKGYGRVLATQRELAQRLERLERMAMGGMVGARPAKKGACK